MLQVEGKQALELGYDRPSPKLLGFLAKHYKLRNYSPQSNNFVVYEEYFKQQQSGGGTTKKNVTGRKENIDYDFNEKKFIGKREGELLGQ